MPVTVTQSRVAVTTRHEKGLLHSRLCPIEDCNRTVIVLEENERAGSGIQESKCNHFQHHERRDGVVYFVFSV
jgi:hypothetical protein